MQTLTAKYRLALTKVNWDGLLDSGIDVDHMCTLFTHNLIETCQKNITNEQVCIRSTSKPF